MLFNVFASFALTAMVTPIVSCSPVNGQIEARAEAQAMTPAAALVALRATANEITHLASDIQNSASKNEFNAATTKQQVSAMMTPLEQAAQALQAKNALLGDGDGGLLGPVGGLVKGLLGTVTGLLGNQCGGGCPPPKTDGCSDSAPCKGQQKRETIASRAITAEEATTYVNKLNGNVALLRAEIERVASAGQMTPEYRNWFLWRIHDDCDELDSFMHRHWHYFHHFDRRGAPTGDGASKGASEKGKECNGCTGNNIVGGLLGTVTGLLGGLLGCL